MSDDVQDIPAGLVKIDGVETAQRYVLVVPGSPDHEFYSAQVAEKVGPAKSKKGA